MKKLMLIGVSLFMMAGFLPMNGASQGDDIGMYCVGTSLGIYCDDVFKDVEVAIWFIDHIDDIYGD